MTDAEFLEQHAGIRFHCVHFLRFQATKLPSGARGEEVVYQCCFCGNEFKGHHRIGWHPDRVHGEHVPAVKA